MEPAPIIPRRPAGRTDAGATVSVEGRPCRPLWIGTFPVAGIGTPAGRGEGIWRTTVDLCSGELSTPVQVAHCPAPSFLATGADTRMLYATAEDAPLGELSVLEEEGGHLRSFPRVSSGGAAPTHLVHVPAPGGGSVLVTSNYGDGTVGVVPLGEDGLPHSGTTALHHRGSGPDPDRQQGSHAHSATPAPGGRMLLVCDLGTDELRRIRLGGTPGEPLATEDGVAFRFRPGSGPRHAAFLPDGRHLVVVTELSAEVVLLEWDGEHAEELARVELAQGTSGTHLPSHLVLSPRADAPGHLLDVADRGPGTLLTLAIPPSGDALDLLGSTPVGSSWPRHFAVVPGCEGSTLLVVAGETENRLTVLRRTVDSPLPELLAGWVKVPSPAFVLPTLATRPQNY